MRYQRSASLLAGERATANIAIGSEGRGGITREEPRPDAWRQQRLQAGRSSPEPHPAIVCKTVHPYSPRHVRVSIDAELNGQSGMLSMLLPTWPARFHKINFCPWRGS